MTPLLLPPHLQAQVTKARADYDAHEARYAETGKADDLAAMIAAEAIYTVILNGLHNAVESISRSASA